MRYLATERGVSISRNDGVDWQELKLNLPTVAVHDLIVKDNDLVLGTNGRSIWIFDDLTPIRDGSWRVAENGIYLFPILDATRFRYFSPIQSPNAKTAGHNPPQGAVLQYSLNKK